MNLPYPRYLMKVVANTILIWLLLRLLTAIALTMAGEGANPIDPDLPTSVIVISLTAALVWLDRHRSHETILHANLGVAPVAFMSASLVTAGALEIATHALVGAA